MKLNELYVIKMHNDLTLTHHIKKKPKENYRYLITKTKITSHLT